MRYRAHMVSKSIDGPVGLPWMTSNEKKYFNELYGCESDAGGAVGSRALQILESLQAHRSMENILRGSIGCKKTFAIFNARLEYSREMQKTLKVSHLYDVDWFQVLGQSWHVYEGRSSQRSWL
ncbi:hypothetical protein QYM36_017029 [Artemia franciscana]|uniref:Uncharacterized protein n=1 Tax=Artemia franciscana TaxID=6661 RepID=A0AA88HC99_ARTSF|nr:hypothetical protein QYM36_017029 [Artemia franciscana]